VQKANEHWIAFWQSGGQTWPTQVFQQSLNESLLMARLGWGLDHETHLAHGRADHPQAQDSRAEQLTA